MCVSECDVTLRTTGLPSLMSWASIMATLWSMVVEWSVLSAEFPTNVPKAKTAAHLTCSTQIQKHILEAYSIMYHLNK